MRVVYRLGLILGKRYRLWWSRNHEGRWWWGFRRFAEDTWGQETPPMPGPGEKIDVSAFNDPSRGWD